jgi:hypothetical protein
MPLVIRPSYRIVLSHRWRQHTRPTIFRVIDVTSSSALASVQMHQAETVMTLAAVCCMDDARGARLSLFSFSSLTATSCPHTKLLIEAVRNQEQVHIRTPSSHRFLQNIRHIRYRTSTSSPHIQNKEQFPTLPLSFETLKRSTTMSYSAYSPGALTWQERLEGTTIVSRG